MSEAKDQTRRQITVRALLLGDRIDTSGLERHDVISTTPLAFRADDHLPRINPRDHACALPNFDALFADKCLGFSQGSVVVGQIHDPRRPENVAVFLDRIEPIFDHRRTPRFRRVQAR